MLNYQSPGIDPYTEGARAHATGSQALADSTVVWIDFDTEVYDTDEIWEGVTNPSRLTCKTAGKYVFSVNCCFDTNAVGVRAMGVYLNRITELMNYQLDANAGGHTRFAGSDQYVLAVNDYIEMYMWQNSGGVLNSLAAGIVFPHIAMQRIG